MSGTFLTESQIEGLTHYSGTGRSKRNRKKPQMFAPDCEIAFIPQSVVRNDGIDTPCRYGEAERSLNREQWFEAMQ